MTNQALPPEAVEAALNARLTFKNQRGMDNAANLMRHILEAAAPHMQQVITTAEELDALPLNSVILDSEGLPLHKDDSDRVPAWCYGDDAVGFVAFPAVLIYRPTK